MKKNVIILALALALVSMSAATLGLYYFSRQNREVQSDTLRVVVFDTVRYDVPVAKDSMVVRYVTRVLPANDASLSAEGSILKRGRKHPYGEADSSMVEVPITQKKYETDDYRAYVSGYEPQLDSIFVFRKTVTETVTLRENPKERWSNRFGFGIGVGAGYGIIHKQADIYIGGVVSYRIWP